MNTTSTQGKKFTKKKTIELIRILKDYYPEARCSLDFETPFELVIAVMLSAQCTDERVNKVTKILFKNKKNPEDFINTDLQEIEEIVHPCGFHKVKANNIKKISTTLVNEFESIVPQTMEELMLLPGIGRKSANVIMLDAFNKPQGIAVDTHVKRISQKIGLSKNSDPLKIEQDLLKIIPPEYLADVNHLFIWHGRNICTAKSPKCNVCPINQYCQSYIKSI